VIVYLLTNHGLSARGGKFVATDLQRDTDSSINAFVTSQRLH
jgi:hypothetical protein